MSLVQGVDSSDDVHPLLVDSSGRIILAASSLEIGLVQARAYGRIGGAWQKQPLLFGYSATVLETWSDDNLASGSNTVDSPVVPAGEIWVITNLSMRYVGTPPTYIEMRLRSGTSDYPLFRQLAPTTAQTHDRQGWWVMAPGDLLRVGISGATAGDDLYASATGFRVDIDL
jgi:hypothetical protein